MIQQTAKILQKYLKLNLSPLNSKENTFLFCASCLIIIIIITIIDIIIIMTKILKGNIGLPSVSIIIVINNYNFLNNNINNNKKKHNKIIEMTTLIKKLASQSAIDGPLKMNCSPSCGFISQLVERCRCHIGPWVRIPLKSELWT